jgi:hypothetical protein
MYSLTPVYSDLRSCRISRTESPERRPFRFFRVRSIEQYGHALTALGRVRVSVECCPGSWDEHCHPWIASSEGGESPSAQTLGTSLTVRRSQPANLHLSCLPEVGGHPGAT